jgi:hypothetical protein
MIHRTLSVSVASVQPAETSQIAIDSRGGSWEWYLAAVSSHEEEETRPGFIILFRVSFSLARCILVDISFAVCFLSPSAAIPAPVYDTAGDALV